MMLHYRDTLRLTVEMPLPRQPGGKASLDLMGLYDELNFRISNFQFLMTDVYISLLTFHMFSMITTCCLTSILPIMLLAVTNS